MFKKIITLLLVFHTALSFAQEITNSFPIDLKSNTDVFQIVDNSNKETTLFVSDRKKVLAFLLDEKMQLKDSISTARPEKKYKDIIGFSGEKSNPRLFWASVNYEKIFSQGYDIKNKRIDTLSFKLDFKNERFLQVFSENKSFCLLTWVKKTDTLKWYIFDSSGKLETKTIDFSSLKILIKDSETGHISDILSKNSEFIKSKNILLQAEKSFTIEKITHESPTSLTESARKLKCYTNENEIIFSCDYSNYFTQLISINLKEFTFTLKDFKKPAISHSEKEAINSNSFLFENKLFQFILTSSQMSLAIKDMNDVLLKEYNVLETEIIPFKNSNIIRRTHFGDERVLVKTSQFLSKANNENCAVSCYNLNGSLMMTLGSVSDEKSSAGGMGMYGMPMNTTFSSGFNMGTSLNPTFGKLDSYANRRVIFFDALLDNNFKPITKRIGDIAFDKIQAFIKKYPEITSTTVFNLNHVYYLGYYDKISKSYVLQKFID